MKKKIISLSVAFAFLTLSITGILLYIKQKSHAIEISHVVFGLLFVAMAAFHIYNNWASLKNYSKPRNETKLSKEIIYVFIPFALILTLSLTNVLEPVAEFGRIFASGKGGKEKWGISFSEKKSNQDKTGKEVVLIVQKNEKAMFADLTIDIVDTNNKVIESLYKKEPKSEGPPSNLILSTKIQTATPFIVRVTLDDKGKKEEYRGEIKSLEAGVYEPIKLENTKLERVIVEVRH
jgi:Domain of unknown function (DUF4405)